MIKRKPCYPHRKNEIEIYADIVLHCDFWQSQNGLPYATVAYGCHLGNFEIGTEKFASFVSDVYNDGTNSLINEALSRRIINRCRVEAMTRGKKYTSYYRFGSFLGEMYVDIGTSTMEAYKISKSGIEKIDQPPCKFIRSSTILPLPELNENGKLEDIFQVLNVESEDDKLLVMGAILACFRSATIYPIIKFTGAQDSGKSYATKVFRKIIDPNQNLTRGMPETEEELRIQCLHGHLIALDNVSSISPEIADALCRLSYGESFSTRKLFTNSEEFIIGGARPVIINGIPNFSERQDLVDRTISIHLKPTSSINRLSQQELDEKLQKLLPGIIFDVLNCIRCALVNGMRYELTRDIRMSDTAAWIEACLSKKYPPGAFVSAWRKSRELSIREAAAENLLVQYIKEIVMDSPEHLWSGTATALYKKIESFLPSDFSKRTVMPKNPQKLMESIGRCQSLLRSEAIIYQSKRGSERTHIFTYITN